MYVHLELVFDVNCQRINSRVVFREESAEFPPFDVPRIGIWQFTRIHRLLEFLDGCVKCC